MFLLFKPSSVRCFVMGNPRNLVQRITEQVHKVLSTQNSTHWKSLTGWTILWPTLHIMLWNSIALLFYSYSYSFFILPNNHHCVCTVLSTVVFFKIDLVLPHHYFFYLWNEFPKIKTTCVAFKYFLILMTSVSKNR